MGCQCSCMIKIGHGSAHPLTSPVGPFLSLAEAPTSNGNRKCLYLGALHSRTQVKAHSSSRCRYNSCNVILSWPRHETSPRPGPSWKSQEDWPLHGRGGKSTLYHFWWAAESSGTRSSILPSDLSPRSSPDSCSRKFIPWEFATLFLRRVPNNFSPDLGPPTHG